MLDFGWQEFMVIAIATVLILGPKELPRVFRTLTGFMRKARSLAGEFHSAMDEMAKEADLADIKKEINKVKDGDSDWIKDIDPTGEVGDSVKDIRDEMDKTRRSVNQAGKSLTSKPESTGGGPLPGTAGGAPVTPPATTEAAPAPEAKSAPVAKAPAAPKSAAKKSTARKATTKTASTKKASAKKSAAKKAPTRKAAAKTGTAKA